MEQSSSVLMVFSNVATFLLLFAILRKALYQNLSNRQIYLSYFLVCLFCVFSFWNSDWWGYFFNYSVFQNPSSDSHMEEFYLFLIRNTPSYIVFRIIIWGGALLMILWTTRRLNLDREISLLCFTVLSLLLISYARVCLAMSIMYVGASFLVTDTKKIELKQKLVGLLLIGSSFYLHKSAVFGIGVILASYVALVTSSKFSKIVLFLFPILVVLGSSIIPKLFDIETDDEYILQSIASGVNYANADQTTKGIGAILFSLLERIPLYLIAVTCYINKDNTSMSRRMQLFNNIAFFSVLFASVFAFDLSMNTSIMYVRFLRFSMIPCFIMLTYYMTNGINVKLCKTSYKIGLLFSLYSLAYSLYLAYLRN